MVALVPLNAGIGLYSFNPNKNLSFPFYRNPNPLSNPRKPTLVTGK